MRNLRTLNLYRPVIGLLMLAPGAIQAVDFSNDQAAHWPRWRGPHNNGVARTAVATEWGPTKNIVWKAAIPGRGHSSPIVYGDKVFITTAVPIAAQDPADGQDRRASGGTGVGVEHRFVVMCFDRRNGKLLWEQTVKTAKPHEGYHFRYGSFASNSPITDGKIVYAFFGSRGVFAYDLNGKLIWKKDFEPMKMRNAFGEGAAPELHGNHLILKFDQEENSHVVVLDKRDGKEIWRAAREEVSSWSQPFVVEHNGRHQAIVSASAKVRSYDVATGKLIWEAAGLGTNVIPNPVVNQGVVYVMSGHNRPNLLAIKLGGQGDLTGSDSILWTNQRGNSYSASPVLDGDKLYFIADNGVLSCLNAKTGQAYYQQQRLPKPYSFKASPVAAGGKLYLSTEAGDVVVVKMGETFEVLATNKLDEAMYISSPAVADGDLFLRDQKTLYCIREGAK